MGLMDGKVALVTGGGRGVGRAIALGLARASAAVVVNDLGVSLAGEGEDFSPTQQVVGEIVAAGGRAVANGDSVASWNGGQAMVQAAIDNFSRIDAVVNNAGNLRDSLFHKMTEEEFDAVIAVHLKGTFNVSRAAASFFKEQRSGAFVHMSSTSGLVGNLGQANYATAKRGIAALSKSVALDMQRFNVRSNAVAPFAWTRMVNSIPTNTPEQAKRVERDRPDLRRAQQRNLSVLAAEADPYGTYLRRLDTGGRGRTRVSNVRTLVLSASTVGRRVYLGSGLTSNGDRS